MADHAVSVDRGEQRRLILNSKMLNNYWYYALLSLLLTVIYFGAGFAFYVPYEGFHFTDTVYFLTQTITTVGYGDVVPSDNVSRMVTVLFIIVGVTSIAAVFSEMIHQIFCVHRDRALKESLESGDQAGRADGKNPVLALLDRQITIKLWASLWMSLEVLVLIAVGVALIYTVEDWAFVDSVYWAVQTLFTVG